MDITVKDIKDHVEKLIDAHDRVVDRFKDVPNVEMHPFSNLMAGKGSAFKQILDFIKKEAK